MKFCDNCQQSLSTVTNGETLKFACQICNHEVAATDSDTLLYQEKKTHSHVSRNNSHMAKNNTLPRVIFNCPNCSEQRFGKQQRINMKPIISCEVCSKEYSNVDFMSSIDYSLNTKSHTT